MTSQPPTATGAPAGWAEDDHPATPTPGPDQTAPEREPAAGRPLGRISVGCTLMLLLVVAVAAILPLRPPSAAPVTAAATTFSATRALVQLKQIATVPHPTGSLAQQQVRDHLTGSLRALGLEPRVLTRLSARAPGSGIVRAGTVSDILVTIPGQNPSGRVLLVAHYDSVPSGPGGFDDGANVAAVLEVVRALRAGPALRNDLEVVLTDGEEHGLLGAQALVDSGEITDPDRVAVVNLEARGVSGPAVMFQMAGQGLVPAVRAAGPVTTSLADDIYRLLPNDTDLTVFEKAGMRGLNFAVIGGPGHYHTAHDDLARVNRNSLQDMGDAALASVRQLAGTDLAADGSSATYFSLFGLVLSYPGALVLPLAGLALLGWLVLVGLSIRRRLLSATGIARAGVTFLIPLVGSAAIGLIGWLLLARLRPDFILLSGNPYQLAPYVLGELSLLLVVLVGWYRWARRRAGAAELVAGLLAWFVMAALLSAVLLPQGAYLFTWPALVGTAVLAALLRFSGAGSALPALAGPVVAAVALGLLLPVILLLLPTLGLSLTAVPLALTALLGAGVLGLFESAPGLQLPAGPRPGRRALNTGLAVLFSLALVVPAGAVALDGYTAAEPRPVSLGYLLETDTGTASWIGDAGPGQPVVGRFLTPGRVSLGDRVPSLEGAHLYQGQAKVSPGLAAPQTDPPAVTESAGIRSTTLRIHLPAGANSLEIYADTGTHTILDGSLNGTRLPAAPLGDTDGWGWGASYTGPQSQVVELELRSRGQGPLRVRMVAISAGLPTDVDGPVLPRDLSWSAWPSVAGQSFVVRSITL